MKKLDTKDDFYELESHSKDIIGLRRMYVDLAEDLVAGVMLSQILFWNVPNKSGRSKLRVYKEGEFWLVKSTADWWKEARITLKQAKRAIRILKEKNLIITSIHRFNGSPTTHIRVNWDFFLEKLRYVLENSDDAINYIGNQSTTEDPNKERNSKDLEYNINSNIDDLSLEGQVHRSQRDKFLTEITTKNPQPDHHPRIIMNNTTKSANASLVVPPTENTITEQNTNIGSPLEILGEAQKKISKDIKYTSEVGTLPDGFFSDLSLLCREKFGGDAFFVLSFLRGIDKATADQILFFANSVCNEFDSTIIYKALKDIERRIYIGKIKKYNITYVYNSITYMANKARTRKNTMKANVIGKFRKFCREYFCKDETGDAVYAFYKNKLKKTGNDDAKIKNIKYLCESYGENVFFKIMNYFNEQIDSAVFSSDDDKSIKHFTNTIKSHKRSFIDSKKVTSTIDVPGVNQEGDIELAPIALERYRDTFSKEHEWRNWTYQCSCGSPLEIQNKNCPKCGRKIDWYSVTYEGVTYGYRALATILLLKRFDAEKQNNRTASSSC